MRRRPSLYLGEARPRRIPLKKLNSYIKEVNIALDNVIEVQRWSRRGASTIEDSVLNAGFYSVPGVGKAGFSETIGKRAASLEKILISFLKELESKVDGYKKR